MSINLKRAIISIAILIATIWGSCYLIMVGLRESWMSVPVFITSIPMTISCIVAFIINMGKWFDE